MIVFVTFVQNLITFFAYEINCQIAQIAKLGIVLD